MFKINNNQYKNNRNVINRYKINQINNINHKINIFNLQ
jgi:hypothetical protein